VDFSKRETKDELMDDPAVAREEFAAALDEIRLVNRLLGGRSALLKTLAPFVKRAESYSVLDAGAGAADIPEALARWGERRGIRFHATALDLSPHAARYAKNLTRGVRGIEVVRGDIFAPPFREKSFDFVVASMMLHHFPQERAAEMLAAFRALARRAFVVNDLYRGRAPYYFIAAATRLFSRSRLVKNDAPLSVLRGFRKADVRELEHLCGFALRVKRRFPYRIMMVHESRRV
jgi:SAM-dependent methyltransferase